MKLAKIFLLLMVFSAIQGYAQNQLTRYLVGNSGCSAGFYAQPDPPNVSFSSDSSRMYTMQSTDAEGITCSLVTIKLAQKLEGDDIDAMLTGYMDFLKVQFRVNHSGGYSKGQILATHPKAQGMSDNWSNDKSEISVMGYSDGHFIGILLIFADKGKNMTAKKAEFFKGFRFPGD